MSIVAVW